MKRVEIWKSCIIQGVNVSKSSKTLPDHAWAKDSFKIQWMLI